jgi:CYTH domain-containing protein
LTSEKDALTEKEWRTTLQKLIDDQQEYITSLQSELENLKLTASEAFKMKKDYSLLQKKCSEYELSLEEIGKQLHESVLHLLIYKLNKCINYYFLII